MKVNLALITNLTLFIFENINCMGYNYDGDEDYEDELRVPKLLIISMDGTRADKLNTFLNENPNSYIQKYFVETGVKADYMQPTYPSNTFPSHFSISTGRYAENHGVIDNIVYDPNYDEKVDLINDKNSRDEKWWNQSSPFWLIAKNMGLKTTSLFWPGSDVWPRTPDFFIGYSSMFMPFKERCNLIVSLIAKFDMDLSLLHFNEPDLTGHYFGPDSEEYSHQIKIMDDVIGYLIRLLQKVNLLERLNIILLSDHGMANVEHNFIFGDYVNLNLVDMNKSIIYESLAYIYPKNDSVLYNLYNQLKNISSGFKVYYKNQIPERFHLFKNDRIAPLIVQADEGYSLIGSKDDILKGNHGFDNTLDSMKCIFMARGPDFKKNFKIKSIKTIDIYPLVCDLLKLNCNMHDSSINLIQNIIFNHSTQIHPDHTFLTISLVILSRHINLFL